MPAKCLLEKGKVQRWLDQIEGEAEHLVDT